MDNLVLSKPAFTLATDEPAGPSERLLKEGKDVIQLVGLYFFTHAATKLGSAPISAAAAGLTQRERQCLMWASRGKTAANIAVFVEIAPRTVVFHLENARRKPGEATRSASNRKIPLGLMGTLRFAALG
ncbi:MAG: hypothetical protein JWP25_6152 [Bradyrhizobium sp.]|nr:hypothetical protein [Bradyrhizobium sp.]